MNFKLLILQDQTDTPRPRARVRVRLARLRVVYVHRRGSWKHGAAEALSGQEPHDMGKPNT